MANLSSTDKKLLEDILRDYGARIDPRVSRQLYRVLDGKIDQGLEAPISFLAAARAGLQLEGLTPLENGMYTGDMTVRTLLEYIPNLSYIQNGTFRP